jgi:inner membrane transporter RhtA
MPRVQISSPHPRPALTRLPARAYGTLTSMEPVIGALLGLFLLHETLTLWQWAGIAGIAAAVLGTAMTTRTS